MPTISFHMERSVETFGEPYKEVHEWLDYMATKVPLHKHRQYRHHAEGIDKVRELFGATAALAAKQHIEDDCWGYIPKASDYADGTVNCFGCFGGARLE